MLPYAGSSGILRVTLIVAVVVHVFSAVSLWHRSAKARARRGM